MVVPPVAARPRGRPRRMDRLSTTATTSRASSTRRSTSKASRHFPLAAPSSSPSNSKTTNMNKNDESIEVLQPSSRIEEYVREQNGTIKKSDGRNSLSSVSNSNDNEGSDYSTSATSAVATPAQTSESLTKRRGRPAVPSSCNVAIPIVNAVARAAALRSSQFSLTSSAYNKRKRIPDSGDETDADGDDSPDAQLARALQEREYSIVQSMTGSGEGTSTRRTTRKIQRVLPKNGFDSGFEEDSADIPMLEFSPKLATRPKIELGSKGSNAISFNPNKNLQEIRDSEESDNLTEIDETEDGSSDEDFAIDSDEPLAMSARARGKQPVNKNMASRAQLMQSSKALSSTKKLPILDRTATESTSHTSTLSNISALALTESELSSDLDSDVSMDSDLDSEDDIPAKMSATPTARPRSSRTAANRRAALTEDRMTRRSRLERARLEGNHPELQTMWQDLEALPKIGDVSIEQPSNIDRELKPFQLQGVAWMKAMEKTDWGGGLLGDEMGMGKTIQAVTLIMSDFPHPQPTLVLIPPVALMQWQQEISDYTDGTLKTFVFHGTNSQTKGLTVKDLKKYNVILMSYNSLESMYRKQEKGFKRKSGLFKEKSIIHQIQFHRVILDEAHNIKTRTTGSAKACFALKADHKWCLSGTPLQNRIGEFFSLVRFLDIRPFACYFCKQCPCSVLNWDMNVDNRCKGCNHSGMQHVSVFNQELLNPIQKYGNIGPGKEAFRKLRILTDRFMLRRIKRDHSSAMELPSKEIYVDRQFFGEEENDFAGSIMNNGTRKFETYVAQGVLLNNYANIFGLIMQMRQVADHPDLILKKNGEGGQNILVCCICDETAEDAVRSSCRHDFCRECAKSYLKSSDAPDCPHCHILLSIDLEQPSIEQDEQSVKKSSIINRIKMENWTSSSKIEALVHDLYELRSKNSTTKSIIFSQFTTMLQLVEWRLRRAGITTVMLDGSMTPAQRQASINHFMTNINVECFLVSLKAGGVALNLTEASKVFIVDPWWNPAAEWQSADRCHRIGQARPCSITRLCIEDSVESRMVLLQEKKANMINSTINADETAMESLTPEDMQFLFRGS